MLISSNVTQADIYIYIFFGGGGKNKEKPSEPTALASNLSLAGDLGQATEHT